MEQKTQPRAVTFPVAEVIGVEWQHFMTALHAAWRASSGLANWAMTQSAIIDHPHRAGDKLEPMPSFDLYTLGFTHHAFYDHAAWDGCKASAATILRRVSKIYAKARWKIWTGQQVLPTFRYPYPYPIHNACWRPLYVDGKPAVQFNMAGRSWVAVLKSGAEFRRQLALFRLLESGECKQGELAIYRQGSQKHVMVKLIGHFPVAPQKSGHTILVRSDPKAFWVCEREGRQEWVLNADHIRRQIVAHRLFLQRIREDTKAERMAGNRPNRNINKARSLRCAKQQNRLDSFCHESTAMLVNFAIRQGAGTVIYDDRCQEFMPSFPWHQLRTKLGYKLESAGIRLVSRDGDSQEEKECPIHEVQELVRMGRRACKRRSRAPSVSQGTASGTRAMAAAGAARS